jgi:hypothetical protein
MRRDIIGLAKAANVSEAALNAKVLANGKLKGMVETSFTVGKMVVMCPKLAKNLDIAEQDFIRTYDLTPAEAAAFRARIERDGSASVPLVIREM